MIVISHDLDFLIAIVVRPVDALMNYVVKNGIDMHAVDSEGKIHLKQQLKKWPHLNNWPQYLYQTHQL